MSTASAKYQFVGAAQYSRSIALLPRWTAWGHAQPKPGVLDMPHLLASGSSMPASPSARLGMEETKGWVGLALLTMRTPFASSEDNRHSCASPATGVARPGISNTVAKNNLHHRGRIQNSFSDQFSPFFSPFFFENRSESPPLSKIVVMAFSTKEVNSISDQFSPIFSPFFSKVLVNPIPWRKSK